MTYLCFACLANPARVNSFNLQTSQEHLRAQVEEREEKSFKLCSGSKTIGAAVWELHDLMEIPSPDLLKVCSHR